MEILKSAVILVIGFVLLIKGADYFVEGSSSVAKKFKVPSSDHRYDDRGNGNKLTGACGQCYRSHGREQYTRSQQCGRIQYF